MRLEPGSKFDRYIIQGILGEGGMGRVYRAFDVRLERRLALKILSAPTEATSDESRRAVAAILREARAAAALDHPNAVSIFELGEHNGVPFIAMELVAGRALRFFVGRPEVPVEQRLHWLTDVAKALDAAHHAGIVHLDVKPENVMVRYDDVVKVLDFGIARRAAALAGAMEGIVDEITAVSVAADRPLVGTPGYMAPEQALREELDGRADQFSWGVVAYELLTGKVPWTKVENVFDLINAVIHEEPPPLRSASPEVPEAVEAIIMRSLAKARGDRFPTMGKLLDELVDVMPAWKKTSIPPPPLATSQARTSGAGLSGRISGAGALEQALGRSGVSPLPGEVTAPVISTKRKEVSKLSQAATMPVTDFDDAGAESRPEPPSTQLAGPAPPPKSTLPTNPTLPAALPPSKRGPQSARAAGSKNAAAQDGAELDDERGESNPIALQVTLASVPAPERRSPSLDSLRTIVSAGPSRSKGASRTLRRRILAGATLAVILGAGWAIGAAVKGNATSSQPAVASMSIPLPPAPIAISDLPAPTSCNEAALRRYRTGLIAYRDGVWDSAHVAFEEAVAADPSCPEAHLRLVMTGHYRYPPLKTRQVFHRAVQLREGMTERDKLLLGAFEPLVRSDPANEIEYRERLRALAQRFPDDAEIANLAAARSMNIQEKLELARRALRIDPHYSDGWQTLGLALSEAGQPDEALKVFEECLGAAPNSVDCVIERISLLRKVGRCADMASDARLWIARDPARPNSYQALAAALASQGSSKDAVEEALKQRWSNLGAHERTQKEYFERGLLDALFGDFDAAEKNAKEQSRLVEGDPSFDARARPVHLLVESLAEAGKLSQAGQVAAEFLKRKDALWSKLTPDAVDAAVHLFEPRLLRTAHKAGLLSREDYRAAHAEWTERTRKAGLLDEPKLWAMGAAMPVETAEEATEALASAPPKVLSPEGPYLVSSRIAGAFAGRALLLADRVDEALPFLRMSAASCFTLEDPFLHTQAHLWLGQALERKGDTDGACAAYGVVTSRWGSATPRSVTAGLAQKRLAALACKR